MPKLNILFVCAGNTCRSPMAQAIALKLFGYRIALVQSAGLEAASGMGATREAVQVMRERGIDLSNHYSQSIEEMDLNNFDIIVAMTKSIANHLSVEYQISSKRLRVLNVADPCGHGIEEYRRCAAELEKELNELFQS
jgi:protein-tyrosine-phosphatase